MTDTAFHKLLVLSAAVVLMVGALWLYVDRSARPATAPPVANTQPDIRIELPSFSLTERSGKAVSKETLSGQVWIADFIFTSCAGPCPVMTRHMKRLQDDLLDVPDITLVSFSVDPDRDTPEVLQTYARQHGAHDTRWLFLTGSMDLIYDLAIDGFKIAVQEARQQHQIIHDTRFMLVDRQGLVRGYYDSSSPEDLQRLRRDATGLAAE